MSRIAAQLFTIRDFTKTASGFQASLARLAEIGYRAVQLSAVGCMDGDAPEVDARTARTMLDEVGLIAPLTHRPWEEISLRTDQCIAFHKALGAELVGLGSMPNKYRIKGLDGYRQFVDDIEPIIEKLRSEELQFGYHNHSFEFERMGVDRTAPFTVLLERGSMDLNFIVDTCWVVHAGVDLVDLIDRLEGRVPMIHLKDMVPAGHEIRMAPIGEGNLNWAAILPACEVAGTSVYAVEQDNCYGRDPFDCLESSYRYLTHHFEG